MHAPEPAWTTETTTRIRRGFIRLGLLGFWLQFVLLISVGLLSLYTFRVFGGKPGVGNVLAFLGLLLPVFTTAWCFNYARLGRSLADARGATPGQLHRAAWIGVWVGVLGSAVALLSLFGATSSLLVTMLANPQVGMMVSPATEGASAYTVSAVDAVSLMALLLTLLSELVVVAISLRLVFQLSSAGRLTGGQ
jgi:hypothetical protein